MNVIFSQIHRGKSQKSLGPFNRILLSFEGLRTNHGGALIAQYRSHQWVVEGSDYFRLDCTSRVFVCFERESESSRQYGPFRRFSAVDGLAYCDDRVVAFLDPKNNEWLYYDSGYHWPVMLVSKIAPA